MDISAVPGPEDVLAAANLSPRDAAMSNNDDSELPVFMVRICTHTYMYIATGARVIAGMPCVECVVVI